MMTSSLPSPKAVRDLFEGLLGKDVQISDGTAVTPLDSGAFGVYVDDRNGLSAVVNLDLQLAAYLGTSIALIPPGGAEAAIEEKYLPETIFDNVCEVLNVFAATLNEHGDLHQRLSTAYRRSTEAPSNAAGLAASLARRLDLTVAVERYGSGRLSCVVR